jgi:hypothetical protein
VDGATYPILPPLPKTSRSLPGFAAVGAFPFGPVWVSLISHFSSNGVRGKWLGR